MIHTDAGYYTRILTPAGVTGPLYTHIWYLRDHLGNNRVLADDGGNAIALHDYDPYGEEISVAFSSLLYPFPPGGRESPYKYGGKEWTSTTSTYDFEARQLAPVFHRFTTMDPLAEKYYSISPYAYCADNPVNMLDVDGNKIVFVNGFSQWWFKYFGRLSPGKDYWNSGIVNTAQDVLGDKKVFFAERGFGLLQSASLRRRQGYEYAQEHYAQLVEGLEEGESFKFVTHSMGASFGEGMADYLREQNQRVEIMLHFAPFQASEIIASSSKDVLTIDIQTIGDKILEFGSGGTIQNAKSVLLPAQGSGNKHQDSLGHSEYWKKVQELINDFLNTDPE